MISAALLAGFSLASPVAWSNAQGTAAPTAAVSPVPTPPAVAGSFEARMKVALAVRVIHSILEVTPGMEVDEAREKLAALVDPKTPPAQEGGDAREEKNVQDVDADADKKKDADADADASKKDAPPLGKKPSKVRDDDDAEGTRVLWLLKPGSPYEWVFIEAGRDEKITAVFGYCWPDKPIPFDEIGDVSQAPIHTPEQVAWDSLQPPLHYRVYATGVAEHAAQVTVSFFALQRKSGTQPAAGH